MTQICSRVALKGMAVLTLAAAAGCQTPAHYDSALGHADMQRVPAVDASLDQITPPTNSLAAQSQRDVEAILRARDLQRGHLQTEGDAGFESALPPPRKTVVWNETRANAAPEQLKSVTAAPAATGPQSTQSKEPEPAPAATGALGPDRLKSLMVDLSRELYATGAYSNSPLRELLMIAAMSMVDPNRQLDPQAIPDLTPKERELLSTLQGFFAQLGKSLDAEGDTEAAIVEAVAKLRESLVKEPTLGLPTAALCTRVGGFGDFTQFEKYSFLAQSQQKVIVYLEIQDFQSELNQKNEYVTRIAQQLVIYSDRDGIPVWKEDWQTAVDITKNRRQDFFTVQVITLPKALSVGKYQLKVRVRDEKSQAEAETTIPFEMVADARLTGK